MIITADYLLTGDQNTVIENGAVLVEGKKIVKTAAREELLKEYPGEEVKEFSGTLMPGMIDLHNHFAYFYDTPYERVFAEEPYKLAFWMASRMKDTLKMGVTTVRDVSSPFNIGPQIKWAMENGLMDAPRIFTCGRGICMTGGHGSSMKGGVYECDGEQECIKAVRTDIKDGANYIKLLTSESFRGDELTAEEIRAITGEAHRLHTRVAAHAGYGPAIKYCIDAGVDTIEHGTHLTAEDALRMKAQDSTWVPTIYVFKYFSDQLNAAPADDADPEDRTAEYLDEACRIYRDEFKKLYDTGVRVACGTDTDCVGYPGVAPVCEECRIMVEYGITPLQAIECATKNGAEALGCADRFGMIREGLSADMIVVEGKPFEDIEALKNVKAVFLEGVRKI